MTTQSKSAARNAKASTAGAPSSNPFEAFTMQMPNVEVPTAFREFAEKSMDQVRDGYAKMKTAAEETTDVVEDTFETARGGAFALGVKAIDSAKANTDASFAFARDLFGAKTLAEVIELQSTFARQQFETMTGQFKEFQELAQKVATDASKPATGHFEKTFKDFKVA